jgi:hypothetical protein
MEKSKPSMVWLGIVLATALLTLAAAPAAVAQDVTYSFNLLGPQTTTNGTQTIEVTGSGSFDPTAGTVVASGSFNITNNSNGAVVSRGTWNATAFNSFCARGGPSPGFQGGVLVITVTLSPNGGEPITDVTLKVTCRVGSGCSAGHEGVTVTGSGLDFTVVTRGATLFSPEPVNGVSSSGNVRGRSSPDRPCLIVSMSFQLAIPSRLRSRRARLHFTSRGASCLKRSRQYNQNAANSKLSLNCVSHPRGQPHSVSFRFESVFRERDASYLEAAGCQAWELAGSLRVVTVEAGDVRQKARANHCRKSLIP